MNKSSKEVEGGMALAGVQLGLQEQTVRLKTEFAIRLNDYLDSLKWTQLRIGQELGLNQPHVSELRNYALERFSADRLLQYMAALGMNVTIQIELPSKPGSGDTDVKPMTIPVVAAKKAKVA